LNSVNFTLTYSSAHGTTSVPTFTYTPENSSSSSPRKSALSKSENDNATVKSLENSNEIKKSVKISSNIDSGLDRKVDRGTHFIYTPGGSSPFTYSTFTGGSKNSKGNKPGQKK
jgi:hypothetical protein